MASIIVLHTSGGIEDVHVDDSLIFGASLKRVFVTNFRHLLASQWFIRHFQGVLVSHRKS